MRSSLRGPHVGEAEGTRHHWHAYWTDCLGLPRAESRVHDRSTACHTLTPLTSTGYKENHRREKTTLRRYKPHSDSFWSSGRPSSRLQKSGAPRESPKSNERRALERRGRVACFGAAADHRAAACVGTCEYHGTGIAALAGSARGAQSVCIAPHLPQMSVAAALGCIPADLRPRTTDTADTLAERIGRSVYLDDAHRGAHARCCAGTHGGRGGRDCGFQRRARRFLI